MSQPPIKLILFDAVGTLMYPEPAVWDVYCQIGSALGAALSPADVRMRFSSVFARTYQLQSEHLRGETSEESERGRWQAIVREVLAELTDSDAAEAFETLWNHFADPQKWRLFADVAPTIAALQERGLPIGIASNFDQRLLPICRSLLPQLESQWIFVSSALGWSKPAKGFYRAIERQTQRTPQEILLVGDDFENDFEMPARLGWQTRWLRREMLEHQFGQIRSLTELHDDFSRQP